MKQNFIGITLLLLSFSSFSGPPDGFYSSPQETPVRKKPLTENDLVYMDTAKNTDSDSTKKALIKVPTVGARSLPGRKGKVLFTLNKNDSVGLLQLSKDKQWQAIYSYKFNKKGWVPLTSLEEVSKPNL